jgi:O-antigen/teichoic acid export membrane protein
MLRNIGSNWVLIVATLAATFVLTPITIRALGHEGYGAWTLITAMTGYIGLLTLGVPAACVQYLAKDVARRDVQAMNETIGSCAGLYVGCGIIACALGAGMMTWFASYDLESSVRPDALIAFVVMTVTVSASFIGLLPEGILFAHHDFVRRNMVRILGVLLRLGLTIGLLRLNATVLAIAIVQLVALLLDVSVSWFIIQKRYPEVRFTLRLFRLARVRRIFSFSLYVLLISAGVRLSFQTDALVIGAYQGVAEIPPYAVANSLIISLMDFFIAIAAVVAPMTTKLHTEGRLDDLREMFLKWSKLAMALALALCLCLMILGGRFIGLWVDPSFEQPSGLVLQILLLSCFVFLPARSVAMPLLMGLGKPRTPALAFIAAGALNLGLSIALVKPLGLAGVALGTAIPNLLFGWFVLHMACRELEIPVLQCVWYIAGKSAIGALPVVALLLWCEIALDVRSLLGLAMAGAAAVMAFAIIFATFVYRDDPYVNLKTYLPRLRGWSRA